MYNVLQAAHRLFIKRRWKPHGASVPSFFSREEIEPLNQSMFFDAPQLPVFNRNPDSTIYFIPIMFNDWISFRSPPRIIFEVEDWKNVSRSLGLQVGPAMQERSHVC
jgi:hypothetical protein